MLSSFAKVTKAVFTLRMKLYDIGRWRTMSYDVVRCRCNWTHWFNGGVHIPHDVVRHRNDTDAEIELGSISASVSHDVVRHPTLSYDVVRSVDTAIVFCPSVCL